MISTDDGIPIDVKPLCENAARSSRDNFESAENVTETSDSHKQKQESPMVSTDDGMAIDVRPVFEKAKRSSRDNFESAENVTDTSDTHN
jgi:hypothetical protein